MKKIVKLFLVPLLALSLTLVFTGEVLAQEDAQEAETSKPNLEERVEGFNAYEAFWPIAAGKVKGDPLYPLKRLKEEIRELLIFSDTREADYAIMLSEKRAVEAEKLFLQDKNVANANKTLEEVKENWEEAIESFEDVREEGRPTEDLENRFADSLEKQTILFMQIKERSDQDLGSQIDDTISEAQELLSNLQQSTLKYPTWIS